MKAAIIDRYGPPGVFRIADVPRPEPKANELLIRTHATVATPSDCAFRSANPFIVRFFAGLTRPKLPILGDTVAGVVEAVGAGVTRYRAGDGIYGSTGLESGAYAEYVAIPEESGIAAIPGHVSYSEAVAIAEGYLTAISFIRDEARLQRGQSILVNGASGSVGSAAVQLARYYGAVVTGVSSARNLDLVRSLGADRAIDYAAEDFTVAPAAYDVIFDAIGKSSFARCREALKPGGIYLTTVPTLDIALDMLWRAKSSGKRAKLATTGLRPMTSKARDMQFLNELIGAGAIRPVIDRTYPLEEIAAAHEYVETERKKGSVVVTVSAEAPQSRLAA
jgi:NADPH:quinone reductase-like Zn-dependent oxidoreductase